MRVFLLFIAVYFESIKFLFGQVGKKTSLLFLSGEQIETAGEGSGEQGTGVAGGGVRSRSVTLQDNTPPPKHTRKAICDPTPPLALVPGFVTCLSLHCDQVPHPDDSKEQGLPRVSLS